MSSDGVVFSDSVSDAFREVAVDAARRAGAFLRSRFGSRPAVAYKGSPTNLVTEMDRGAETIIVEAIRARFPDHAILAEESGALPGAPAHRWIVDPLDGTTNYAHGLPIYGVSIGLEIDGGSRWAWSTTRAARSASWPSAAAAPPQRRADPGLPDPAHGREPSGHELSQRHPCRAPRQPRRARSAHVPLPQRALDRLRGARPGRGGRGPARRLLGAAARGLGRGGGRALIREAGGTVTSVHGGPLDLTAPSITASNGAIHAEILEALKEVASTR